ncbi:hypothetical protein ABZP36_001466 [Zizania latifolia]
MDEESPCASLQCCPAPSCQGLVRSCRAPNPSWSTARRKRKERAPPPLPVRRRTRALKLSPSCGLRRSPLPPGTRTFLIDDLVDMFGTADLAHVMHVVSKISVKFAYAAICSAIAAFLRGKANEATSLSGSTISLLRGKEEVVKKIIGANPDKVKKMADASTESFRTKMGTSCKIICLNKFLCHASLFAFILIFCLQLIL